MNASYEHVMVYVPNQMKEELECGRDMCRAAHTHFYGLYWTLFN